MTADQIAYALDARKVGACWMACCPAHDDRNPSLSIRIGHAGQPLVHCHAGCDQRRVIDALKARGLWGSPEKRPFDARAVTKMSTTAIPTGGADNSSYAMSIWHASRPAAGTLVERYLESRGIRLPVGSALRFHSGLKHPSGGTWPAMVALVTDGKTGSKVAIHRTFLAHDGCGKAFVNQPKMMLGPCSGGAVRLALPGSVLMVGEGIETSLAAMQETGNAAWAALSTSGLRALDLPEEIRDVIVLADGDENGEAAARACAVRWKREGRRVRIARPPKGRDFNDLIMPGASRDEEYV